MMRTLHYLALLLTVVGALNWGLVGLFDFNLVHALFGAYPVLEKLIYALVGASALLLLATYRNYCAYDNRYRRNDYPDKQDRHHDKSVTREI